MHPANLRRISFAAMWSFYFIVCHQSALHARPALPLSPVLHARPALHARVAPLPAPRMQAGSAGVPEREAQPSTAVALTGGDEWVGSRVSKDEVRELCDEALSTTRVAPIIKQFYTSRTWLWRQWSGTIVKSVLPREVIVNVVLAVAVSLFFRGPGAGMTAALKSVNTVWLLACSLVTFTISFFLTQSYAVWRNVYTITRRVQGRLNDLGLLCATCAQRDEEGEYTDGAQQLLALVARYVRLFSVLLYASCTTKFAPLATPAGLAVLVEADALTAEERERLLESSMAHNAVLGWIWACIENGLRDGRLGGGMRDGAGAGAPTSLRLTFESKLLELRGTYASIADTLSGRMPLAYTQLVQILLDSLLFGTPFALMHSVGGAGAIFGTGVITFFYSSVLNLAKVFLDPFDNESESTRTGISLNVATLIKETCLGSERWRRSVQSLPAAARRPPSAHARAPMSEEEAETIVAGWIDEARAAV